MNVVHSSSAHVLKQSLSRHWAQVGCQEVKAAMPCKNMLAPQRESQRTECSTLSYINPSFSQTSDTKNLRTTFPLFFWVFFAFQQATIWTLLNGVYKANPESSLDNTTSNHPPCHLTVHTCKTIHAAIEVNTYIFSSSGNQSYNALWIPQLQKFVGLDTKGNLNRKEHTASISVNGDLGWD